MTSSLDPWRSPCGGDPRGGWSEGVDCRAVVAATLVAGRSMLYTGQVEREEAVRVISDVAAATVVPDTRIDLALPVSRRLEGANRPFDIPDAEHDAPDRHTGAVWAGGPGSPRPTAASPNSLPTSTDHWGNALDRTLTYHER